MNKKIQICLIIPFPPPYGGITNWSVLLKKYMDNVDDVEYDIIDSSPKKKSMKNISMASRIFSGAINMFAIKKQLKKLLLQKKIDVVHITTSGQFALFRDLLISNFLRKRKIPFVYHIRFGRVPELSYKKNLEFKMLDKVVSRSAHTIALDKKTADVLLDKHDNKILIVPNPFDFNKLKNIDITDNNNNNNNNIVFAGWVIKSKGIEELLSAWDIICDKYSNYSLKICGPYKDEYYSQIKAMFRLKRVTFTGELDNNSILQEISNSEILILPSYTEGFPNVVLEAMALGKAVIASNVGAIPEILSNECGIVISPKSSQEIVSAIETLVDNCEFRRKISINAFKKVKEEYSIEKIYDKYKTIWLESIYENKNIKEV